MWVSMIPVSRVYTTPRPRPLNANFAGDAVPGPPSLSNTVTLVLVPDLITPNTSNLQYPGESKSHLEAFYNSWAPPSTLNPKPPYIAFRVWASWL